MSLRHLLTATVVVAAVAAPTASARPLYDRPAKPVPTGADEGFDVGSAAIGAGGAGVVLLLAAAGVAAVGLHGRRPTTTFDLRS